MLVSAMVMVAAPASADDDFIGLYAGVVGDGGSFDHISIVPHERRGDFQIMLHATHFGACDGVDKRAVGTADGTVSGGVIRRREASATCLADNATVPWPEAEMSLSRSDELLVATTPAGSVSYYHRISD